MFSAIVICLVALTFFGPQGAEAECLTDYYKKQCLTKDQMPDGYGFYFASGDPCFESDKKRWCFVTTEGNMESCDCSNAECGCKKAIPPLKCDKTPKVPADNCQSDRLTYCPIIYKNPFDGREYQHTMCLYCGVDMSRCSKICARGLNKEERTMLVDYHNKLRRKVAKGEESRGYPGPQPSASNMNELEWSNELAKIAQTWADQCIKGHDKNRLTKKSQYSGQNIASFWAPVAVSDKGLKDRMDRLYNEVKDWPWNNIDRYSTKGASGVVGHYTQLVWAATKKVGCGFINHYDIDSSKAQYPYKQVLICNYYPGGNILGQPVYMRGSPGSKCPKGTYNNDGLCRRR